ncbi:hypothetical protein COK03_24880 [Priestia megaterium]|jgi:hypothetical protein|nr:hypothetical protein CN492_23465 [Priestia megaterium]PFP34301.1 hypothetical protein COK03_24880 [Priestia megaterium]
MLIFTVFHEDALNVLSLFSRKSWIFNLKIKFNQKRSTNSYSTAQKGKKDIKSSNQWQQLCKLDASSFKKSENTIKLTQRRKLLTYEINKKELTLECQFFFIV